MMIPSHPRVARATGYIPYVNIGLDTDGKLKCTATLESDDFEEILIINAWIQSPTNVDYTFSGWGQAGWAIAFKEMYPTMSGTWLCRADFYGDNGAGWHGYLESSTNVP